MNLQYHTVEPKTIEIIQKLMAVESLKDFYLVGGTALALQWGHRISEDIDMFRFNSEEVDGSFVFDELESVFKNITELGRKNYYIKLIIDSVKIDILRYNHPLTQITH